MKLSNFDTNPSREITEGHGRVRRNLLRFLGGEKFAVLGFSLLSGLGLGLPGFVLFKFLYRSEVIFFLDICSSSRY